MVVSIIFGITMYNKCSKLERENILLKQEQNALVETLQDENKILTNNVLELQDKIVIFENKIDSLEAIKKKVIVKTEFVVSNNITEGVLKLKENNYDIISTYLDNSSNNINNIETKEKHCVVMGNEGKGISDEVGDLIKRRLFIPSYPQERPTSESLNVGMATAITIAEFRRRM